MDSLYTVVHRDQVTHLCSGHLDVLRDAYPRTQVLLEDPNPTTPCDGCAHERYRQRIGKPGLWKA